MYFRGDVPEFCKDCYYYEPIDDGFRMENINAPFFTELYVSHRNTCHCKCIYCYLAGENSTEEDFVRMNKERTYDIKPFFEYLDKNKLINENTIINLMGGESTEYQIFL